ncbi:PAS domain-containing protein [Ramlibacter aquaticus]|uniref:histidine kinase n=1 Tax=Ramlibacter aquaticus TaxID=2780094 RepID=A0ABR9SJW9_9BURK|nr:PAS domain-containing protein [Ramlibacter aquaticus]MBE7942464.1 PAS domain-containing protein [Ramlibacter aquaticus]
MQGRLTLRERLVVLVAAALLPVGGLSLWVALRESHAAAELARAQLRLSASLLASNEDRLITATEQLLRAIAAVPGLGAGSGSGCQAFFRQLRDRYGVYTNIGLAAPDGHVVCHALEAQSGPTSAAGRDYFQRALASGDFVMGQPVTGRVSGLRGLPFALPLVDGGRVTGVLFALANLEQAADQMKGVRLPPDADVAVSDRQGRLLMAWPAGEGDAPSTLSPVLPPLSGEAEVRDAAGERRVYAFGQTRQVQGDGLVVRVGLARPLLGVGAAQRMRDVAAAAGLTLAAMLLLAWWLGGRFILRPTDRILRAVHAFEQGDLGARVPMHEDSRMELSRIGAAFNRLADSLQGRQEALEAELQRSHHTLGLLDLVLNSMQEALLAVGPDGERLLSNRAAGQLFPQVAEAPGTGWFQALGFFGPDGETPLPAAATPLALAAAGGTGQALVFLRNAQVPEGRLVQCSWQPIGGGPPAVGGLVVFTDLTEKRRLEVEQLGHLRELEEARAKLEEAQRIGRMGHWEEDPVSGRLWWSDEVFVLFGMDPTTFDFSRRSFLRHMHPEDRGLFAPTRLAALREGRLVETEYRVLRPDGRLAWMHEIAKPRLDAAGEPTWLSGVVQDVTERKLQEQALRAGEQAMQRFSLMLQRAAEAAPTITARPTVEGVVDELCGQVRRVLGAREARLRTDLPPGLPLADAQAMTLPLCGADGRVIGSLQITGKHEGEFDERDLSVALELSQLATVAIRNAQLLAQVRELNAGLEQRIAERTAELSRQERLFRALAEQAPEVVWNTDASGAVTFLNRAWYALVGGSPADSLGLGWLQAVHPEDRDAVIANWERSRGSRAPYSGTRRFLGRDGHWHTMSYRATPILDEAGNLVSWVGIDADVSGLKAIEAALRTSNQELEAFSYSVSHDLRAPLAAIAGFSQALQGRLGQDDPRVQHYLARILAGVHKMERQIEAMLSLSRVTRAPLEWTTVDLSAAAEDTLEALRMAQPERVVHAQVQPGLATPGDPRLLRVVLENLLGNAWKFSAGVPEARIEFGHDPDQQAWFVRDNGVGFDMAYAGKLFNAFHRLHTEAEFPGTGVGLATVRRIVARHLGRVWASSAPGRGTTVYFSLPEAPPAWDAVAEAGRA